MKKTYTSTLFIHDLTKATVVLRIYGNTKYEAADEQGKEVTYKNVRAWSIVDGADAKELEAETDGSCIDEYGEYLVLEFADGDTATFRNSHVDMWVRG